MVEHLATTSDTSPRQILVLGWRLTQHYILGLIHQLFYYRALISQMTRTAWEHHNCYIHMVTIVMIEWPNLHIVAIMPQR